jgi:PTS system mannose-specific IIA component
MSKMEGGLKMIAIIIGTHGKFSQEILRSSEMIFGKQENVSAITFEPGESADELVEKYKKAFGKLDCNDGVIFLVDLFGGSPFNAASRIVAENENMDILTGVNLPMLLEIYGLRDSSNVKELVDIGKKAAYEGIKSFKEVLSNEDEDEL